MIYNIVYWLSHTLIPSSCLKSQVLHDVLTSYDLIIVPVLPHVVETKARSGLIVVFAIWIELRIVKLCIAELGNNLLSESTAAFSDAREHAAALLSEIASAHESWILNGTEGLIWRTHLLLVHVRARNTVLVHLSLVNRVHRVVRMHLAHTAAKALEAIMTWVSLRFSARKERVVTELLR